MPSLSVECVTEMDLIFPLRSALVQWAPPFATVAIISIAGIRATRQVTWRADHPSDNFESSNFAKPGEQLFEK
ncbi:MAG: hypothetical protein QOF42_3354 [Gammaproteobacteria bacterium]|jgi:hypothetical protein|nr:hypothetical protein [Gammaproteobacteria bacterium]